MNRLDWHCPGCQESRGGHVQAGLEHGLGGIWLQFVHINDAGPEGGVRDIYIPTGFSVMGDKQ